MEMVSFMSDARGSGILLSTQRLSSNCATLQAQLNDEKPNAPPLWPAMCLQFLHSFAMGTSMMTVLEVCRTVLSHHYEVSDVELKVKAQAYYGHLMMVLMLCTMFSSQAVGVLSDKYGRRPLQLGCQLGQLIDHLVAGLCLPSLRGHIGQLRDPAWCVLFFSRATAGLLGRWRITLQSYTADISTAEQCPTHMAYLGGVHTIGLCTGTLMATAVANAEISFRASFLCAACGSVCAIGLVSSTWRDIAPRKDYTWRELNPFASFHLLAINRTMVMYSILLFLVYFSLNMFTSVYISYCETFLKMKKKTLGALNMVMMLECATCMFIVQPALVRQFGEISTIMFSFLCMILFYLLFSLLTIQNFGYAFVIVILYALGSMSNPLTVSLATREVAPELQGRLQGAIAILETLGTSFGLFLAGDVLVPAYSQPGQFFGMVFFVPGLLLILSLWPCCRLYKLTGRFNPDRASELQRIG